MAEGTEKKVKFAQFKYYVPVQDVDMATGKSKDRLSPRIARRDEWVVIPRQEDVELGERTGAFYTDAELNPVTDDDDDIDSDDEESEDEDEDTKPSHDELVTWIREEHPNATTTVARAGDDPELARALIRAENEASGGYPRTTVIRQLERIQRDDPNS